MSHLIEFQFVAVVLAATLATIAVWAPRRLWIKASAVLCAVGFMPVAYAGMTDLLSKPKPVRLEWVHGTTDTATVLGAQIRENEAIYLWLQVADAGEPRYYKLPWSLDLAKQLQEAMREAEKSRSGIAMKLPFENSNDPDKPKFYAVPQPKLPEKGGAETEGAPLQYRHPGVNA